MKRRCSHIISSKDGKRKIYVDEEAKDEIMGYIEQDARHRKKFLHICEIILGGHRNSDLYDKEEVNDRCKDVTAMKLFKGQENDRIYCKEVHTEEGVFVVVAAVLLKSKKNQKLNNKQINLIEKVGGYTYEI